MFEYLFLTTAISTAGMNVPDWHTREAFHRAAVPAGGLYPFYVPCSAETAARLAVIHREQARAYWQRAAAEWFERNKDRSLPWCPAAVRTRPLERPNSAPDYRGERYATAQYIRDEIAGRCSFRVVEDIHYDFLVYSLHWIDAHAPHLRGTIFESPVP